MLTGGMVPAVRVIAVHPTRAKLCAFVLVAVVIGLAGTPLFAGQKHCDTKPHDCGKVTRIAAERRYLPRGDATDCVASTGMRSRSTERWRESLPS